MTSGRKDSLAVLALLGLLFLFFQDLFLVRSAPLIGDSLEQHYPWAYQLAQSLKNFRLPFWTPLIQCGFPLVAESQVGAFYVPNLILLGLLPFHAAYSYMNLLHWFIAGWGTYAYAKQMKLGAAASFVAAVIFVFGGAYGGAYYNMTSLKTICWFPVALFFLERYLASRKGRFLFGMAAVIGQSLVAGYLQMSALTWLMFGAYAILRIFLFPENIVSWKMKARTLGGLTFSAFIALLLALPQIYLTFHLTMGSARTGLQEGYAYVGSMSPLVLVTLAIPKLSLILRSNNLYAGSFALFLLIFSFFVTDIRKIKSFRIWTVMTLLALLLSLGQWSPLYVAIIKLTKFYSFRFPAKFIGFICFGLAMLSAVGFQALWQGSSTQAVMRRAFGVYLGTVAFFVTLMISGNLFLTEGKNIAIKLGEFYVMKFFYGKPGHPHLLETYLEGVRNFPDHALKYISLSDPVNIWMLAMTCFCIVLLLVFLRKKIVTRSLLGIGILFMVVDLYAASFLDIQLDLAPYKKALAMSPILEILKRENAAGKVGRIYGFRSFDRPLLIAPAQNMLYGISDVGAYSPLVFKRYNESIGLLGSVNDSNCQQFPPVDFVQQRLPLLSFLNVSHVLSSEPLGHANLMLLGYDNGWNNFLYRNAGVHHSAYFISQLETVKNWDDLRSRLMAANFDPSKTLLLEKEELKKIKPFYPSRNDSAASIQLLKRQDDIEEWQITTTQDGFFVIPDAFYVGWQATVNAQPEPILKAYGLFRAIRISHPGSWTIRLCYKPFPRD